MWTSEKAEPVAGKARSRHSCLTLIYGCVTSSQLNPPAFYKARLKTTDAPVTKKFRIAPVAFSPGEGAPDSCHCKLSSRTGRGTKIFIYITHDDVPVECDRLCTCVTKRYENTTTGWRTRRCWVRGRRCSFL